LSKKRSPSVRPPPAVRQLPADARPKNRLLATLPDADFRRIRPHLTTVALAAKQILLKRGDPIRYVYFPNGGVCSVTAMMKNGAAVESPPSATKA
jgi:CRP-like cAMP-binding protein